MQTKPLCRNTDQIPTQNLIRQQKIDASNCLGVVCDHCFSSAKNKVLETREVPEYPHVIRRRHQCGSCGNTFSTYQIHSFSFRKHFPLPYTRQELMRKELRGLTYAEATLRVIDENPEWFTKGLVYRVFELKDNSEYLYVKDSFAAVLRDLKGKGKIEGNRGKWWATESVRELVQKYKCLDSI